MSGVEDRAHALGEAVGRDLVEVAVEEAGVVPPGLLGEHLDARAGGEGGAGLVERDVPVRAHAEQLHVHAAGLAQRLLVGGAGARDVRRPAVRTVHGLRGDVRARDELPLDHGAVGLGVSRGQADVLVQQERAAGAQGQLPVPDPAGELVVDGQGRGAGGQPQDGLGTGRHVGGHRVRAVPAQGGGVGQDDDLHQRASRPGRGAGPPARASIACMLILCSSRRAGRPGLSPGRRPRRRSAPAWRTCPARPW